MGHGDYSPLSRKAYGWAALALLVIEYAAAMVPRYISYNTIFSRTPTQAYWMDNFRFQILFCGVGAVVFACTAMLGWLSLRRGHTIGASVQLVGLSIIPWLQLFAIAQLIFGKGGDGPPSQGSLAAFRGALWGLGIALGAEIVLTLAFGEYGIALFVGTPFVVGIVTAYFARRDGYPHPLAAAQLALVLASLVLFGFAFEGLFCLVLAYPLAAFATLVGGAIGIGLAMARASRNAALSSIALLPLLLAIEAASPPLAQFSDVRSVDVAAPPDAVWDAIVHMGAIRHGPAAPFNWGLAYPVAGRIDGAGVGAVRLGVFSTGTAYERVTRWDKDRELWFDVLSDPPMMRETNPFGPVYSTHLNGYFKTGTAKFSLRPLPGGKTRLTLVTDHSLMVGPTPYFEPLARWAVAENKRRVLAHFREGAERLAR